MKLTKDELKAIIKEEINNLNEYSYERLTSDEKKELSKWLKNYEETESAKKLRQKYRPTRDGYKVGEFTMAMNPADPSTWHPQIISNLPPDAKEAWELAVDKIVSAYELEKLKSDAAQGDKDYADRMKKEKTDSLKIITPRFAEIFKIAGWTPKTFADWARKSSQNLPADMTDEKLFTKAVSAQAELAYDKQIKNQREKGPFYKIYMKTMENFRNNKKPSKEEAREFLASICTDCAQSIEHLKALPPPKRSFMQKAGSFMTGKGFNEDITKEDIQKIIQEEVANMEESAHGGFRGYTGPDDDEPESEEAYVSRMRRKQEFDRERFARAGTGISSAEMKAREKAAEEEAQYKKDQARRAKNLSDLEADKQEKKAHKDKIARAFINIGDANITKQIKRGNLGYWAKVAAKELDGPILNDYLDDPETLIQMMSQRDVKRFAKKAGYNKKRSFMQKAGSFMTGKGFNEDITKEDIQKMVQEELEAVTKGN